MFKKIAAGFLLFTLVLVWMHHNVAHAELKAVSSQGGSGGGGSVTWPTSGDAVISSGNNTPTGVAEVDGECLIGATGAWAAGSCSGSATAISALVGSTTINVVDNKNFAQNWSWNTLTGANALTLSSTSVTTGTLLALVATGGTTGPTLNVQGNAAISGTTTIGTAKIAGGTITGTTFDNGVIGGVAAAAATFTLGTAARFIVTGNTVATNGIYLPVANTVGISANSLPTAEFLTLGSAVDYFTFTPGKSGTAPLLTVNGSTANQGLTISTTGTGALTLNTAVLSSAGVATHLTFDTAGASNSFKINGTAITSISGNSAIVGTTSGSLTSSDCLQADASGNIVTTGAGCGGGGGSLAFTATSANATYYPLFVSTTSASGSVAFLNTNWGINPSLLTQTVTGAIIDVEFHPTFSTSQTIDWNKGNNQELDMTSSLAVTTTMSNGNAGENLRLVTCNTSGATGAGITFANGKFSGASQPGATTTSAQCDVWFWTAVVANGGSLEYWLTGMTPGIAY